MGGRAGISKVRGAVERWVTFLDWVQCQPYGEVTLEQRVGRGGEWAWPAFGGSSFQVERTVRAGVPRRRQAWRV